MKVESNVLVKLPESLSSSIFLPDWSVITSAASIKYVVFFVLVGSLESLLTVSAVNSMDPSGQRADSNRDLLALGAGNIVSGLLGGLPMISEIVRSKANIDGGATSGWANFFHGSLVLVYLTLLGGVLGLVPVAALAGVLVYVGVRLASPKEFAHAWHTGKEEFAFFAITCVVTIVEDLLVGIGAGLAAAIVFELWNGARPKELLAPQLKVTRHGTELHVCVNGTASFSNFHLVRSVVERAAPNWQTISIDLSKASVVDHGFLEKLDGLTREIPGVSVQRSGLDQHCALCTHPNATRVLKRDRSSSVDQSRA